MRARRSAVIRESSRAARSRMFTTMRLLSPTWVVVNNFGPRAMEGAGVEAVQPSIPIGQRVYSTRMLI